MTPLVCVQPIAALHVAIATCQMVDQGVCAQLGSALPYFILVLISMSALVIHIIVQTPIAAILLDRTSVSVKMVSKVRGTKELAFHTIAILLVVPQVLCAL